MLQIISPAKSLNFSPMNVETARTKARFHDKANELVSLVKQLSIPQLQELLGVSTQLAQLNYERFQTWVFSGEEDSKPAVFAYNGDVYEGLDVTTLSPESLKRLQSQLRIISGLYGVLRPLDTILPYRLEMSTPLKNSKGKDLYAFWSDTITQTIIQDIHDGGHQFLINLASNEYSKAIQSKKIPVPIIDCQFKEYRNGKLQMISFFAKKARGMMVRYIAQHNAQSPEHLQGFDYDGYIYNAQLSTEHSLVFTR